MIKQRNWIEKGVWGLLIVLNALFLYYWVVLAANYCMHYDDVHFMWKLREYSIFEYVREMYMTRGGNFVGYGFTGLVFKISNWIGAYYYWPILFYVLGIVITWGAFRNIPFIKNSSWRRWLGIITLYNVYVLTSVDYAVFNWICASTYYLYAPLVCLILRYLYEETLKWWQWVFLYASAFFIFGNTVSISTATFVVLFAYGIHIWYKEGWNIKQTWAKPQVRRLLVLTVVMLVCFAIVFVAPGNWNRLESGDDMQHPESITEFGVAIVKCIVMFLYMMAFYLPYHLIAMVFGAWTGIKYPVEISMSRQKAILVTIVVAFAYLLVCVIPLAYLSNGFGIQRNYIQLGFFYILTFFAIGYFMTNNSKKDRLQLSSWSNGSIGVCTIFLIVVMALNIRQDLPVARAYNKAHQEREAYLLSLQEMGNKETVVVEPYPSTQTPDAKYNVLRLIGKKTSQPAIYYEADTDVEPNEYEGHIKRLYRLDFDFVLAESKE